MNVSKTTVLTIQTTLKWSQGAISRCKRGGGRRQNLAENGNGGGPDSGQSASACNGSPLPLLSSEGFTSSSSSAVWKPADTSFTLTAGDRGKLNKSRCISKPNTYARSCADAEAAKPAHAHPPRRVTSDVRRKGGVRGVAARGLGLWGSAALRLCGSLVTYIRCPVSIVILPNPI